MEETKFKDIMSAVKSTEPSLDGLKLTEVGSPNLLVNAPIGADISAVGTAYATQNNVQVSDAARKKDRYDLLEIDWDYKKTTSKPFILDTGLWQTSDSAGANLLSFSFPNDYFTGNHVLRTLGETFLSMRGDLHFVVSTQGTPLASGALIIHPDYDQHTLPTNMYERYLRQHAILDISDNSSTADLVVPFKYFRNGTDPFSTIYTVLIDVLVPLAGMKSVNYTVTCFLENQEFKFLRPLEAKTIRRTQGLFNITTINNNLSQVENATLPSNVKGDDLDVDVGMMDDVGIPTNPTGVLIKFNSLNNTDNPHYIEKVSLTSSVQSVCTTDIFNTDIDEMSFHHLFTNRDHYYKTYGINTAVTTGQQIANIPLVPTPVSFITPPERSDPCNILEYYSGKFKFWRGGLKYKFRFYMNRFQSIKLYFGLFYKALTPTTFTDWSSSHGVVVDIGGDQREVILEIPYNAETPFLQVPTQSMVIEDNSDDSTIFDFILGQLAVYALTPLISPEGSPTSITMHVTMSTSDDFELATYTTSQRVTQGKSEVILMSKESTRTPEYLTDTVSSVKQLIKKWQNIDQSVISATNDGVEAFLYAPTWIFDNVLPAGSYSGNDVHLFAVGAYYSYRHVEPYHAYRGGLKFRMELNNSYSTTPEDNFVNPYVPFCIYINPNFFNTDNVTSFESLYPALTKEINTYFNVPNDNSLTPYIVQPINGSGQNGEPVVFEVEIPFQRNLKYVTRGDYLSYVKNYGLLIFGYNKTRLRQMNEDTTQLGYSIFTKIADDGRFGIINNCKCSVRPYASWIGYQ
jgi:hypothetical protein